MAKFASWYGIFQYIRPVRVEYVVRISSVASLYIGHWKVFKNISLADRQTDRQICIYQNRYSVLQTENIGERSEPQSPSPAGEGAPLEAPPEAEKLSTFALFPIKIGPKYAIKIDLGTQKLDK